MNIVNKVFFIIIIIALASCTAQRSIRLDVVSSDFKEHTLSENQGFIVVYRGKRGLGNAFPTPVFVDNEFIGEIGPKSYIKIPLKAGDHNLWSFNEFEAPVNAFHITPGATNYFKFDKESAWTLGKSATFNAVEESMGEQEIEKYKRIATGQYATLNYYKKVQNIPENKAILFAYRPLLNSYHRTIYTAPTLKLNEKNYGQIPVGNALKIVLDPGNYEAYVLNNLKLNIELEENTVNFLRLNASHGSSASLTLWELLFFGTDEPLPEILPAIVIEK